MIDKELLKNCSKFPGIYVFKNTVNGKCYVGQAINLRNRLKAHLGNFKNDRYDNPLYRAVKKYTWDVFEYSILEILETTDFTAAKKELDILEVKYIKEFDSYNNGYNQTLGGDGGILGYKMTQEQIQKIKDHHVEPNALSCILYNLSTKEYLEFKSQSEAARFLECCSQSIQHRCCGERKVPIKGYLVSNTKQGIEDLLNLSFDSKTRQFKCEFTKEEFMQLLEDNPIKSSTEISSLGMCKKTFYNYLNRFDLKSPFNTKEKIDYIVIYDSIDNIYIKKSLEEVSLFFNISKDYTRELYRKYRIKLYKKRYNIIKVVQWEYSEHVGKCEPTYKWKNKNNGKILHANVNSYPELFRITDYVNDYILINE